MTGREFEDLILFRMRWESDHCPESFDAGRYGVQATTFQDKNTGHMVTQTIRSLPDFEGVINGQQFVFEAKVVSGASFAMKAGGSPFEGRQLRFMLKRARAGAVCFVAIHWNYRELKTKSEEEATYVVPIHPAIGLWQEWATGELRTITRSHCKTYGFDVKWGFHSMRAQKVTPDMLDAILWVRERIESVENEPNPKGETE